MIMQCFNFKLLEAAVPLYSKGHRKLYEQVLISSTFTQSLTFIILWGMGIAQWWSTGLMCKRSWVWVPAGAEGTFSPPESTFCADSYFCICSTPMLLQQHTKDPSHYAKSASGRLQLNMHAPYLCGFEQSDTVNWCMVVWCTQNMHWDTAVSHGTSHVSTVTTSVDIRNVLCKSKPLIQLHMTRAQRVCSEAENSAIVAIVKHIGFILRWGARQVFIWIQ